VHITAGVYMRGACSAPPARRRGCCSVVTAHSGYGEKPLAPRLLAVSQLSRRCLGVLLEVGGLRQSVPTQRAVHAAGSLSDWLRAALLLAALAPAVRDAVRRAAASSLPGAALLLAAVAPAVHGAVWRAAMRRRLGAALVLAPPAPSMRMAVIRAGASSHLVAALMLAPPCAAQ
jgi:hypothetical protein